MLTERIKTEVTRPTLIPNIPQSAKMSRLRDEKFGVRAPVGGKEIFLHTNQIGSGVHSNTVGAG